VLAAVTSKDKGQHEAAVPKNAVAKIAVEADASRGMTKVTVTPLARPDAKEVFEVATCDTKKATEMLRPMLKERIEFFKSPMPREKKAKPAKEPAAITEKTLTASSNAKKPSKANKGMSYNAETMGVKEVAVDKASAHLKVLASHGIVLDGMTCATAEDGRRYWICPEEGCERAYTRPSKLKIHLLGHREVRPFKCTYDDCTWAFVTAAKLRRHIECHKKKTTFSCPEMDCAAKFATEANMKTHVKRRHGQQSTPTAMKRPVGARPFACLFPNCGWTFATASKLRRHERSHAGAEARSKHVCPLCERGFLRSDHLRGHMRTHTPAEAFVCPYAACRYAGKFKMKTGLYAHLRREHRHTGSTTSSPMRCLVDGCRKGFAFVGKEEVSYHARMHHKNDFVYKARKGQQSLLLASKKMKKNEEEDPILKLLLENLEVAEPEISKPLVAKSASPVPLVVPRGSVLLLPDGSGAITVGVKAS